LKRRRSFLPTLFELPVDAAIAWGLSGIFPSYCSPIARTTYVNSVCCHEQTSGRSHSRCCEEKFFLFSLSKEDVNFRNARRKSLCVCAGQTVAAAVAAKTKSMREIGCQSRRGFRLSGPDQCSIDATMCQSSRHGCLRKFMIGYFCSPSFFNASRLRLARPRKCLLKIVKPGRRISN
jgi:hypothetical protein